METPSGPLVPQQKLHKMDALAVILEQPGQLSLRQLELAPAAEDDVVVDISWSAISSGTERLLWQGRMPWFPGLGYPLVPGYESVGRVTSAGVRSGRNIGESVFVPGADCFGAVRGLFGGAASRVVVPGHRILQIPAELQDQGTLLALAATAMHALAGDTRDQPRLPELIVGHGVVGRLLARLTIALGGEPPTVWEMQPTRREGDFGYQVIAPEADTRRDYRRIVDASGDSDVLDSLIPRLAKGGEIVLAGFYPTRVGFTFPPAFMRETTIRIAAEWRPDDLANINTLLAKNALSLEGLISHHAPAGHARAAYATAFNDPSCLKMVLDWSEFA